MEGIGPVRDRSTDDLLRQAAQDAGLEPETHYQGALGATFEQKKASFETDQHRTNLGVGEKVGAMGIAKAAGAKFTAWIESGADAASASLGATAPFLRAAAAGNVIVGTVAMAYELLDEGLARPNAQADALRSAANNDAAVVGLSHALDMPEPFKVVLARMRPEVATQGGAAMAAQFPVHREGPRLGAHPPAAGRRRARGGEALGRTDRWCETDSERLAAMKAFQASDVGKHAGQDAAYGLGVAEALWAVGARGRGELTPARYDAVFNRANARLDASRPPIVVQG